jgi:hypothetical protein
LNLLRFIEIKYGHHELSEWNIGVVTKRKGKQFPVSKNITVNLIERTQSKDSTSDLYYIRKSHIISPDDEFIDLNEEEKIRALAATKELWTKKGKTGEPNRINGEWVRNKLRKPNRVLLLIYFLDPEKAGLTDKSNPIVGFAISFPGTDRDDAVEYAVHEQLLSLFDQEILFEDFEEDED